MVTLRTFLPIAFLATSLSVGCVHTLNEALEGEGGGEGEGEGEGEGDVGEGEGEGNTGEGEGEGGVGEGEGEGEGEGASCTFIPDPSRATAEPSVMAGMTVAHNAYRLRVGGSELSWSESVAASAQTWAQHLADTCDFAHSGGPNGENIFGTSSTSPVAASDPAESWASERALYDFGTDVTLSNFQAFGHYTQMVWRNTTSVGCGMAINASCPGTRQMWVCQYAPPGNFLGEAPYGHVDNVCVDLDNDDTLQGSDPDDHDRDVH